MLEGEEVLLVFQFEHAAYYHQYIRTNKTIGTSNTLDPDSSLLS
jgi:hypothetical protein